MALGFGFGQSLGGWLGPAVLLVEAAILLVGGDFLGAARWRHNEEVYRTGRDEEIG